MVGVRQSHNVATLNLAGHLRSELKGSPCRVFIESVKTRIEAADCFFYPDVVVTCDARDRATPDYVSHPLLVVEVLSDSTAAFDRGNKFAAYRKLRKPARITCLSMWPHSASNGLRPQLAERSISDMPVLDYEYNRSGDNGSSWPHCLSAMSELLYDSGRHRRRDAAITLETAAEVPLKCSSKTTLSDILKKILATKHEEVAAARSHQTALPPVRAEAEAQAPPRDFAGAPCAPRLPPASQP